MLVHCVRSYAIDLKVDNLMLYPDFEYNFEMFEPLRSMQVCVCVTVCVCVCARAHAHVCVCMHRCMHV